jgi:hypothetical protein
MKKLKLSLDALEVESFSVEGPAPHKGTVPGQQIGSNDSMCFSCGPTCQGTCNSECGSCAGSCWPDPTCYATCAHTCEQSCGCYGGGTYAGEVCPWVPGGGETQESDNGCATLTT